MNVHASQTIRAATGCGALYVTTSGLRITATLGKAGGCAACHLAGHSALIEVAQRHGATVAEIADALRGMHCHQSSPTVRSCVSALGETLAGL